MKKVLSFLLVFGAILSVAFGAWAAEGDIKKFRIGHILSDSQDDPYQVLCMLFAQNVADMSGGKIQIEVAANAQMGSEQAMQEGMRAGTVDMAMLTNVNVGGFIPQFFAFDLPFMFPSKEKAYEVLDGPVGQAMLARFEPMGIKALAWGEGGFRHMINKARAISSPSDVLGLKFRSLENDLYIDTYRSLGTEPIPLTWTDTMPALQAGAIDGLDIPVSVIYANKFNEAAPYLTLTNHFYSPLILTVSMKVWNSLSPEEQAVLTSSALKAGADERAFVTTMEEQFLEEMASRGLTITRDIDFSAFQEAVSPVYDMYREKIGSQVLDEIFAATAE